MNKNIVKNYEVDTKLIFPIAEHFKLHTLFGISQKNEKIKWKPLVFFVHTGISFFFIQENTKEIGSISLKYSSGKNVLDLQIKMRVEY